MTAFQATRHRVTTAAGASADDVHVVHADMEAVGEDAPLVALLSEEERRRAAAYRSPEAARRFALRRGLLRTILAAALPAASRQALRFSLSPEGKPYLDLPQAPRFSLSVSGRHLAVAYSFASEPGIDVVTVDEAGAGEGIVDAFFSSREREAYRATAPADRPLAFARAWAQKEAVAKASGQGVRMPFESFEVELRIGAPPALLAVRGDDPRLWGLADVSPERGLVAILACRLPAGRPFAGAQVRGGRIATNRARNQSRSMSFS